MKFYLKSLFLSILFITASAALASAQMTDEQVVKYLSEGVSAGKTEAQLGNELLERGVSVAQIQRLLKTYKGSSSKYDVSSKVKKIDDNRARKAEKDVKETEEKKAGDETTKEKTKEPIKIFGHQMFSSKALTFEPNDNQATPSDYVLGPGDELIIDIWGDSEATLRKTISPEGNIMISQVGRIDVGGMQIKDASAKIKKALSSIYSSLGGRTQIAVTLGNIRTIQVNIIGDVSTPGTYRLSPFSTVFNAIYKAGGITEIGSLRDVQVMRDGSTFSHVDLYSYLFHGKQDANVSLKEGDTIHVPPYCSIVSVSGAIKRPMCYEMMAGESLQTLIEYAGGFSSKDSGGDISVVRHDGTGMRINSVPRSDIGSFTIEDGDSVEVSFGNPEIYANAVEVRGAVNTPGFFELGPEIATVKQLIVHAGGLLDEAYLGRAQILREMQDRSLKIVAVPLAGIMKGIVEDILLKKNDVLIISDTREVEQRGNFTISGYVQSPGQYEYAANTTVEDLILLAGGLADGASTARVDVARRIKDEEATSAGDTLAVVFSFPVSKGQVDDADKAFYLEPFDVVSVRKSPKFVEQKMVTISGEVTFPGQYALLTSDERLSDLIARAGGVTPNGSAKGGMLLRKINQYERNVRRSLGLLTRQQAGADSLDKKKLLVSEIYTVGIELDKAMAKPHSEFDVILRDGDEIVVPATATTVRVQGEVPYPNSVQYVAGKPVSYYVHQAGGYGNKAKKSKVYVIHMNGKVSVGPTAIVDAGSEIVVPARPETRELTSGEILSIGTSAASLSAMIVTIVNQVRNGK